MFSCVLCSFFYELRIIISSKFNFHTFGVIYHLLSWVIIFVSFNFFYLSKYVYELNLWPYYMTHMSNSTHFRFLDLCYTFIYILFHVVYSSFSECNQDYHGRNVVLNNNTIKKVQSYLIKRIFHCVIII